MSRMIDPDLPWLNEADQIRLSSLGVRLDGRIGSRLQREVAARRSDFSLSYEQGWADRDRIAAKATELWVQETARLTATALRWRTRAVCTAALLTVALIVVFLTR